jgi:5-methylcytosine-specific restriction endonuclease McrA
MMTWPEKHFERFHDWNELRSRRSEGWCVCGLAVDPKVIDEFDQSLWCSHACARDVALRCGLLKAPVLVGERDRGICSLCGADAGTAMRAIEHIRGIDRWDFRLTYLENRERTAVSREAVGLILDAWGVTDESRVLWDADHIVPVIEGGGGCGLENYRTLCVTCHRGETSTLASHRAEKRRAQRPLFPMAAEPD